MALSPLILDMLALDIFTITSFWLWLKTILSMAAAYRQNYRFFLFRLCYRKEFATLFSTAWTSSTKRSACLINSQWYLWTNVWSFAWSSEVFSPLQRRLFRSPFHLHDGCQTEVLQCFKQFYQAVFHDTGRYISTLQTDQGPEYTSRAFQDFLLDRGVLHETTARYSPEQNEITERDNRTNVECLRILLPSSGLPVSFWGEAATMHSIFSIALVHGFFLALCLLSN